MAFDRAEGAHVGTRATPGTSRLWRVRNGLWLRNASVGSWWASDHPHGVMDFLAGLVRPKDAIDRSYILCYYW